MNYYIITESGKIISLEQCAIIATEYEFDELTEEDAHEAWPESTALYVRTTLYDVPRDEFIFCDGDIYLLDKTTVPYIRKSNE
tara:strand:- start:581 stop:829 length:249 start_codon:yes stop_codon:yes gene_type:complete